MMNQECPVCKREGYIKPLDGEGFRCGYCGEKLYKKEPEVDKPKPKSKPKSTAKNKMETPNDPAK